MKHTVTFPQTAACQTEMLILARHLGPDFKPDNLQATNFLHLSCSFFFFFSVLLSDEPWGPVYPRCPLAQLYLVFLLHPLFILESGAQEWHIAPHFIDKLRPRGLTLYCHLTSHVPQHSYPLVGSTGGDEKHGPIKMIYVWLDSTHRSV